MTVATIYVYKYVTRPDTHALRNALVAASALACASLIKGIFPLLFFPGYVLFAAWSGRLKAVLQSYNTYIAVLLYTAPVAAYYVLREIATPGYVLAVWNEELGGRYFGVIENHQSGFLFYFDGLRNGQFLPWMWLLPIAVWPAWFSSERTKQFTRLLLCVVISYWLVISFSQTKLDWYSTPMLPFLAVVVGIGMERVYEALAATLSNQWTRLVFISIFVLTVFAGPYTAIVGSITEYNDRNPTYQFGYFIRHLSEHKPNIKSYTMFNNDFRGHMEFYRLALAKKNYHTRIIGHVDSLYTGETVMVCHDSMKAKIETRFNTRHLEDYGSCALVELLPKSKR
jgi:4-amino-4-deoxy-L-arabinose transferase-like glycosyltransferase